MRLFPRLFITAILLAASIPAFAVSDGNVSVTTLPNGMRVIVREGHAVNLVAVDIFIKAGSVNETEQNNGLSHFVEHMIFKATKKYGPGQIDREIEGVGAELNGGTTKDWVHFYTTVASGYLPTALDVVSDAIMNAQFRPEDMEKERQVVLDEIARANADPTRVALDRFMQVAYSAHPYRLPLTGTRESMGKLTRDDLVVYYNRYYVPANTCISIAGDVSPAEAVSLVQHAFAGFDRPAQAVPAPPVEPPSLSALTQQFQSPDKKAYVVLGYHVGPTSEIKEACTLDVILAMLGDTFLGRISEAMNAKGIKFTEIKINYIIQRDPSVLTALVSVDPADADKVVPILESEFGRLVSEMVSDGELSMAKRLVEGSDLFDQETFSGQARTLGLYDSIGSYDYALKYAETVRSVMASDVAAVARKYFAKTNSCTITLKPGETQ